MTVSEPPLYTDRDHLRTAAYADTTKLVNRMAIYDYQTPRHDLRTHVREFLSDVDGPMLDVGCGAGSYTRALREARPGRPLSRPTCPPAWPPPVDIRRPCRT